MRWIMTVDVTKRLPQVGAKMSLLGDDRKKTDEDIHAQTAAKVFAVGLNEVTKEMRSRAKAVNLTLHNSLQLEFLSFVRVEVIHCLMNRIC